MNSDRHIRLRVAHEGDDAGVACSRPEGTTGMEAQRLVDCRRQLGHVDAITVNTFAGIRDVRGSMLEIGRAYGATEWQIFWKIILPAAVPFVVAGIRLAVGLAIIGIIVAEFFTAISGLGGMIVEYANVFATAKLFVPIIVIAIVGVVLTELVMWLERRMSRWRQLERERF